MWIGYRSSRAATTTVLVVLATVWTLGLAGAEDDLPKKILPFKHVAEYACELHGDKNQTKGFCGEGLCRAVEAEDGKATGVAMCDCLPPNMHVQKPNFADPKKIGTSFLPAEACSYRAKNKKEAFLYSLFLGILGVDWFYLAAGNRGFMCVGAFKLLTFGGLGIWWIIDIILILTDQKTDGMGMPLFDDLSPPGT